MVDKIELIKWLLDAPGECVGIDEGGLTLVTADRYGREDGAYYEIGGIPEVFDMENQHPEHSVENWSSEVEFGNTCLDYTEWVDAQLYP